MGSRPYANLGGSEGKGGGTNCFKVPHSSVFRHITKQTAESQCGGLVPGNCEESQTQKPGVNLYGYVTATYGEKLDKGGWWKYYHLSS